MQNAYEVKKNPVMSAEDLLKSLVHSNISAEKSTMTKPLTKWQKDNKQEATALQKKKKKSSLKFDVCQRAVPQDYNCKILR